jgi:hypothetical protein
MSFLIKLHGDKERVTVSMNITSQNWSELSDGVQTWINEMLEGDDSQQKIACKFIIFCAAVAGEYSEIVEMVMEKYKSLNN